MPAARTADDKLLALLARMPAPMETGDIAEALGWSRQNVVLVAGRLVKAELLVRLDGERDGEAGRPQAQFALPGSVCKAGLPRPLPIAPNTYVVTPSGEE